MKCIHLASFNGNIGDVISHEGAYNMFKKHVKKKIKFTKFEIRDIYNNKKKFDESFVNYVNTFDFMMIGGGNYFEFWVKNSPTGTSINIKLPLLNKIKIPILVNSMGVDMAQGANNDNLKKFKKFIKILIKKKSYLSFRNDGAKQNLRKIFKEEKIFDKFNFAPDNGFFLNKRKVNFNKNSYILGINIAGDMKSLRYKNENKFLKNLSKFVYEYLLENSKNKIFIFPHIYKDYEIILNFLKYFEDDIIRKRIKICELNPSRQGLSHFLKNISNCNYMLSMRLHSNIASMVYNIPTIGLLNYPQIKFLYSELNLNHRLVESNSENLQNMINKIYTLDKLKTKNIINKINFINKKNLSLGKNNYIKINKWLNNSI